MCTVRAFWDTGLTLRRLGDRLKLPLSGRRDDDRETCQFSRAALNRPGGFDGCPTVRRFPKSGELAVQQFNAGDHA